jgi:hypothetical protein
VAVSVPGGKRLVLAGFRPQPMAAGNANDNAARDRPRLLALP